MAKKRHELFDGFAEQLAKEIGLSKEQLREQMIQNGIEALNNTAGLHSYLHPMI